MTNFRGETMINDHDTMMRAFDLFGRGLTAYEVATSINRQPARVMRWLRLWAARQSEPEIVPTEQAERLPASRCTRCRGTVLGFNDGTYRCANCGRAPGWELKEALRG